MTITQVAKEYDLTPDTLRYYERIGLIPVVPRNQNGIRNFDKDSCKWVEFVKCMRNAGLSIESLVEYVTLFEQGEQTVESRKELLIAQREVLKEKLEGIQKTIQRLDVKIKGYDQHFHEKEKELYQKK